jgi:hypothetical protein
MMLTENQRQQLGASPEWRDMQIAKHNIYSYLSNTKLEDLKIQEVINALNEVSMRRAAFLEHFIHNHQGGV